MDFANDFNDFDEDRASESVFSEEETDQNIKNNVVKKRKLDDIPTDDPDFKLRKKIKNQLCKPPTVEELNNLKETENLYNNNLFRLQIQELVTEIQIKNKRKKNIIKWLECFEEFLTKLPEHEFLLSNIKTISKSKLREKEKLINKLASYKTIIKTDQDVKLKLGKPEKWEKFGLYENDCLPGPKLLLNLNLKMSSDCFLNKDYLNNRYLTKRYYYLLYIAEYLKNSNITTNIIINYHEGNNLLPILLIEPSGCNKTVISIFVSPSEDFFKPYRFRPEQNNVKTDEFNSGIDREILRNSKTIYYNSALSHDITLTLNNDFIKEQLAEEASIKEAVKLLLVWMNQRQLNIGFGSFNDSLVLYFVVYLYTKKKINKFMSSYQVIRNFWNFLTTADLPKNPISIGEATTDILNSFKDNFDVVCLDKSGCYNVAAFLSLEMYEKVKVESTNALKLLDDSRSNSFQQLFLTKVPFYLQYDLLIDLTKSLPLNLKLQQNDEVKSNFIGYRHLLDIKNIKTTLKRAFGKRILNLVPRIEIASQNGEYLIKHLYFGLNLNPEEAFNYLEKGPALNDHIASAEFRKFWGELASDRRFRDGSTNVAVYFRTNTLKGKRNILKRIVQFVLEGKLKLKYEISYDQLDKVLVNTNLVPSYPSGTNEETTLKIIKASDDLGQKIRSFEMSLKVTGVQGICEIYSFTEVFPPIPTNYEVEEGLKRQGDNLIFPETMENIPEIPRYVQTVDCVLQLEHSSKWPSDIKALRHLKTSFYLEISKMLRTDHEIMSRVSPEFLEVFHEGVIFRYRLLVPKEIGLLKKQETETGLTCYRMTAESAKLERCLNLYPKLIAALRGVHSAHPSFGPGTALVKRWLRSQLIDDFHFPDVVLSLLNASLYLNGFLKQPNTPQQSFLRFLKFFSEFDWNIQTIVLNFNEDISAENITELESKLQENRDAFQPLYIVMPYDEGLSTLTKSSPWKEILNRIKQLAMQSLSFVEKKLTDDTVKDIFIPNYEGYNLLIRLKRLSNSRRLENFGLTSDERVVVEKFDKQNEKLFPIVNFDPVEKYLSDLRKNYGKYAMFFHDSYGGDIIAVLWYPNVFEKHDFKVNKVDASVLVDGKVIFNMDAVIEDFFIYGNGLVETIEKQ